MSFLKNGIPYRAVAILPLLLVLALSAACSNSANTTTPADRIRSDSPQPVADEPPRNSANRLAAIDLASAYVNDAAAADKLYKGKQLTVFGRVESVLPSGPPPIGPLNSFSGQTALFFRGQMVLCILRPDQKALASQIGKRDRAVIAGTCDGKYGERVVLKDCVIQKTTPADSGTKPAEE